MKNKIVDENFIKPLFETNSNHTEWFGYYHYDVISRDGKKMLCNRGEIEGTSITADDKIDLGYYDIESGEWNYIDTTDSWNWQQGAMLQWIPGEENEDKVIYNISTGNHFNSVIYDVNTKEKKIIDYPIYCITPDGKKSISLNYERSYWCRAYHYQPVVNPDYDVRVADDDGIFEIDLESNTRRRIVDIHDVIKVDALDDFDEAKHWFEHIMISPSGKRFVFLHRFSYCRGYVTRVCVCDIDGSNLQVLPNWQKNFWSHIGWKGDEAFALYTVKRDSIAPFMKVPVSNNPSKPSLSRKIKDLVKKALPQAASKATKAPSYYQLYELKNGEWVNEINFDDKLFDIDGHPSFALDGEYMITDSYPDLKQMQRLMIYNTKTKKVVQVGSFFAAFKDNPASCDLHPKLSYGEKYLAVDTAYSGKHRMILFEINWDKVKDTLG